MNVLISRGFVIALEDGIVVIRHWKQNNYIQGDRYKPTIYQHQMAALSINGGVYELDTNCIQSVPELETQVSLEENSKDKGIINYSVHFEKFWSAYPRKKEKAKAYKAYCTRLKDGFSESELLRAAQGYAAECNREKREEKYIKLCATFLSASTPFTDYLDDGKEVGAIESENKGRGQASDYFRRFIRDCDCNQG